MDSTKNQTTLVFTSWIKRGSFCEFLGETIFPSTFLKKQTLNRQGNAECKMALSFKRDRSKFSFSRKHLDTICTLSRFHQRQNQENHAHVQTLFWWRGESTCLHITFEQEDANIHSIKRCCYYQSSQASFVLVDVLLAMMFFY